MDSRSQRNKGAKDKYELSESNIIKTFKTGSNTISSNKLYYYPKNEKCYRVIKVNQEEGKTTSVTMTEHINESQSLVKETITLSDKDIDTLRDYIFINLKFHSDGAIEDTVNTKIRLQRKLEDELQGPVLGATSKTLTMFKFFFNSKLLDKEDMISKYDGIKDEICLYACTGYSKAYTFKRFHKPYEWPYWGYYGTTVDAIAFIPNQNVVLCGWSIYGTDRDSFELKYKIYVDDNIVEEEDSPMI